MRTNNSNESSGTEYKRNRQHPGGGATKAPGPVQLPTAARGVCQFAG